jgi:hypothetical protein
MTTIKLFLPKIILHNQGGFIVKTQIIDNIILVYEAIHVSKAKGDKGMTVKINVFE